MPFCPRCGNSCGENEVRCGFCGNALYLYTVKPPQTVIPLESALNEGRLLAEQQVLGSYPGQPVPVQGEPAPQVWQVAAGTDAVREGTVQTVPLSQTVFQQMPVQPAMVQAAPVQQYSVPSPVPPLQAVTPRQAFPGQIPARQDFFQTAPAKQAAADPGQAAYGQAAPSQQMYLLQVNGQYIPVQTVPNWQAMPQSNPGQAAFAPGELMSQAAPQQVPVQPGAAPVTQAEPWQIPVQQLSPQPAALPQPVPLPPQPAPAQQTPCQNQPLPIRQTIVQPEQKYAQAAPFQQTAHRPQSGQPPAPEQSDLEWAFSDPNPSEPVLTYSEKPGFSESDALPPKPVWAPEPDTVARATGTGKAVKSGEASGEFSPPGHRTAGPQDVPRIGREPAFSRYASLQEHLGPVPVKARRSGFSFCDNILGLFPILLALLAAIALILWKSLTAGSAPDVNDIFRSWMSLIPFAVAAALTSRADGGMDLSLPSCMLMGAFFFAGPKSFVLPLLILLLAGALNGVLVAVLRLPDASTLATSVAVWGSVYLLGFQNTAISLGFRYRNWVLLLGAVFVLILGFVYAALASGREESTHRYRNLPLAFFAFPIAALLAGASGAMTVMRAGSLEPGTVDVHTFVLTAVLWAALHCSKIMSGRFAVVPYICVIQLLFLLAQNACALLGLSAVAQTTVLGGFAVILAVMAGVVRLLRRRAERPSV